MDEGCIAVAITARRGAPSRSRPAQARRAFVKYLLDTNVVSELRRPRPHGAVLSWLAGVPDEDLYLSTVTIGELQAGVEVARKGDPAKAKEIEAWLDKIAGAFNILSMDARALRCWGRFMHGKSEALIEDAMIAAPAEVHNLIVVTRTSAISRRSERERRTRSRRCNAVPILG